MAVSAFKSTSKRGNIGTSATIISSSKESNSETLTKKFAPRRSRSVSAFSRNYHEMPSSSSASSSSSSSSSIAEFLNKRDNPLFCSSSPLTRDVTESENTIRVVKLDENVSKSSKTAPKSVGSGVLDSRRGRSVSRFSDGSNHLSGREKVRSLSRVDPGRRQRSLSRGHYDNFESEVEQESDLSSSFRNQNKLTSALNMKKKSNIVTTALESSLPRTLQTRHSQNSLSDSLDGSPVRTSNWGDGLSLNSFSEAEEKTIKAVFEQMKSDQPVSYTSSGGIRETVRSEVRRAISEIRNDLENDIRSNNSNIITTANVADIPPELVNPNAVELVLDIRRAYARKLEESQERARKLQADLAVEEQRGKEFSRILKEILPDPKTSDMQKSRARRTTSTERRKMSNSKRLMEEALNYFDECVSISTFDSSDFSSPEDPLLNLITASPSIGESINHPCGSSSASTTDHIDTRLNSDKEADSQEQYNSRHAGSNPNVKSISSEVAKNQTKQPSTDVEQARNFRFSFDHKPKETHVHQDIRNYIKKFEKENQKDGKDCEIAKANYYDADDYKLQAMAESLLFDRVILRKRIVSGSLLLCVDGFTI